jgi:LPS-assembly lipoprotein
LDTPETVAGFRTGEQLEKRLGVAHDPRYLLRVRPSGGRRAGAITSDGDTVRFNVIGSASWSLRDLRSDKVIEAGKVESFTSYSATGSTVATQAAETDANSRLSVTLADMIVSRLLILSPRLAQ